MKQRFILFVSTLVLSIVFGNRALAYDVEVDGIFYNIVDGEAEVTYGTKKYVGDVIIPESIIFKKSEFKVTRIGKSAFEECSRLSSIELPNTISYIGDYAFPNCTGLTSITIPNSVTHIGYYAFADCTGLTSIIIPNSVKTIGNEVFVECI